MGNSKVRSSGIYVYLENIGQLIGLMYTTLRRQAFKVVTKEEEFNNVPLQYENCRLDENIFPSIKFNADELRLIFHLEGPDDIIIPVGGFGKLSVIFVPNGFIIENKGYGVWEFTVL